MSDPVRHNLKSPPVPMRRIVIGFAVVEAIVLAAVIFTVLQRS